MYYVTVYGYIGKERYTEFYKISCIAIGYRSEIYPPVKPVTSRRHPLVKKLDTEV